MNILGLDTSTKTGAVVLSDDPSFNYAVELEAKKINGFDRLVWFRNAINNLLDTYSPELVVLENYGFANAHTLVTLVEIGTTIRMVLHDRAVPYVDIAPTSLKKAITGKGVAQKEAVMLAIYKRWGFEAATNNIADAYGLAKIGQYLLGMESFTKDVVTSLEKIESVKSYRAKISK